MNWLPTLDETSNYRNKITEIPINDTGIARKIVQWALYTTMVQCKQTVILNKWFNNYLVKLFVTILIL